VPQKEGLPCAKQPVPSTDRAEETGRIHGRLDQHSCADAFDLLNHPNFG
jgi:hypothetical protein